MKNLKKPLWAIGVLMAISLVFSALYIRHLPEESHAIVSYITIGIDQTDLAPDRSLHDIQRAEEHFSDMVLAWTVAPDFIEEMNTSYGAEVSYSGRRQEKQNLLFTYETDDLHYAEQFVDAIDSRIQEYNAATFGTFNIARESHTATTQVHSKSRLFLGFNAMILILLCFGLFAIDYAYAHRRRP